MRVITNLLLLLIVAVGVFPYGSNDRPIIGILSREVPSEVVEIYGDHSSLIVASYVKFVEGAGGRVVPIRINQSEAYYREVVAEVNGLLFPGGAGQFNSTDGYAAAGKILYDLAIDLNNQGEYFPIWGICLGFELLLHLAAGQKELRSFCPATNIALPLQFTHDFNQSSLFSEAPENILTILMSENVTYHLHTLCVTQKNLTDFGLSEDWHVLSVNNDKDGVEFISTVQSRKYPFYGTIFHPEKNGYEWKTNLNIPHSANAVAIMQYFAGYLVNEARKNLQRFPTEESEESALIYNHYPTYTANQLLHEQVYFFDN